LSGDGLAFVSLDAQGVEAGTVTYSGISAESVLEVFFEVTGDQPYRLDAIATWREDTSLFGGHALVSLLGATNGSVLAELRLDSPPPGTANLDTVLQLTSGISYHLRAASYLEGSGDASVGMFQSTAEWSFRLSAVPEPSVWASILTTVLAWRCRRRRHSLSAICQF
jgi:hypothetical protein